MGAQYPNIMAQGTTETTTFTPELCEKWLNQLSSIKAQIMSHYESCNIKECISDQVLTIEDKLDVIAIDISEILKQQSLNDKYFYHNN